MYVTFHFMYQTIQMKACLFVDGAFDVALLHIEQQSYFSDRTQRCHTPVHAQWDEVQQSISGCVLHKSLNCLMFHQPLFVVRCMWIMWCVSVRFDGRSMASAGVSAVKPQIFGSKGNITYISHGGIHSTMWKLMTVFFKCLLPVYIETNFHFDNAF